MSSVGSKIAWPRSCSKLSALQGPVGSRGNSGVLPSVQSTRCSSSLLHDYFTVVASYQWLLVFFVLFLRIADLEATDAYAIVLLFAFEKILNKHIGIPARKGIIHPAHQWCLVSSWYPRAIHLFPCQRHFSSWLSGLEDQKAWTRFSDSFRPQVWLLLICSMVCGMNRFRAQAVFFVGFVVMFSQLQLHERTQGSLGLRASLWVSCFVSAQKQEGKKLHNLQLRWGPLDA